MANEKKVYSATDAAPVVLYAKLDAGSQMAEPLVQSGGSLKIYQENHVCLDNTTSTPLGIGETFTGVWQDCLNYQEVNLCS